jgi:hypothetical protein
MKWKIDTNSQDRSQTELTPLQRAFIADGYTGEYSKGQIKEIPEKIRTKANNLPKRFENLIKDIVLLYKFGELELDLESKIRDSDLIELYEVGNFASEYRNNPNPYLDREGHGATRFGVELGAALRFIFEANDCAEEHQDFVWGIMLSEVESAASDEEEAIEMLYSRNSDFISNYYERINSYYYNEDEIARRKERREERRQFARKIVVENGLKPSNELVNTIMEDTNINSTEHENKKEEMEKFIHNNISEMTLAQYLRGSLQSDTEYLESQPLGGISRIDLLNTVWKGIDPIELDTTIRIESINPEIDSEQAKITKALRHLHNHYEVGNGPNYAITKEINDGRWGLTGYGKALALQNFEIKGFREFYEVIPEEISMMPIPHATGKSDIISLLTNPSDYALQRPSFKTELLLKAVFEQASLEILASKGDKDIKELQNLGFDAAIIESEAIIKEI